MCQNGWTGYQSSPTSGKERAQCQGKRIRSSQQQTWARQEEESWVTLLLSCLVWQCPTLTSTPCHPSVLCYCHLEAIEPGKQMKTINQEMWLLSLKQLRLNEAFQLTPFQAWLVATNPWTPNPTPDGIHHDCVMVDWKPIVRNTFSQKGKLERLKPLESKEILLDREVDLKKRETCEQYRSVQSQSLSQGRLLAKRAEHWEVTYIWSIIILGNLQRKTRSGLASTLTTGYFWKWAF